MSYALPKDTVLDMAAEYIEAAKSKTLSAAVSASDRSKTQAQISWYKDFMKRVMLKENKKLTAMFGIELHPRFDSKSRQMHLVIRDCETKEEMKEVVCYDEAWH